MTNDQIALIKKNIFKKLIRKKIKILALDYLQNLKMKHSKVKEIQYETFEIQQYMLHRDFSNNDKELLFKLRTRMINVKSNFRNQYENVLCQLCDNGAEESQSHLLECPTLLDNCPMLFNDTQTEYGDIFECPSKQLQVVRLFQSVLDIREKMLNQEEDDIFNLSNLFA